MKKIATHSRKEIWDLDPAGHIAALSAENGGSTGPGTDHALVQLVWKHFAEEITEILSEVQETLTTDQESSTQPVTQRK